MTKLVLISIARMMLGKMQLKLQKWNSEEEIEKYLKQEKAKEADA